MRGLLLLLPLLACGGAKAVPEPVTPRARPTAYLPPLPDPPSEEEEIPTPTLRVTKISPTPTKSKTVDRAKPEALAEADDAPIDGKAQTYVLRGTPAVESAEASSTWTSDPSEPRPSALDPAARTAYKSAYRIYQEKRPREALDAFAAFVLKYPDHPYVEQATYWRGECYVALGDSSHAMEQFRGVVARFPGTPKAHEAEARIAALGGNAEGAAR